MDGTLLDENKQLSPDFWETEQKLFEKGVLFSVASGRQFYNLLEVFDRIKERTLFLAENGTYAYYKGKEIFVNPLPKKDAVRCIKIGRKAEGINMILCGKNAAYLETRDERFVTEVKKHFSRVEFVDDLTEVDDTVLKVSICDFRNVEKNSLKYFEHLQSDYKIAVSGAIWLDITNLTANKGTAILKIQKELGITYDETMVFGDYLNDLEMMETGKYSYAMKNAHTDILKIAGFVTAFDNNNSGVTQTINELVFV